MNYQRIILIASLVFITVAVIFFTVQSQNQSKVICPEKEFPPSANYNGDILHQTIINNYNCKQRRPFTHRFGEFSPNISSPEFNAGLLNDSFTKFRGLWIRNDEMINWLSNWGKGELDVFKVFNDTSPKCQTEGGLVLDIGSNTGFYGMLSATYGCEVYFFDPQPWCQHFVGFGVLLNQLADRTFMVPHGVANVSISIPVLRNVKCSGGLKSSLYKGWNSGVGGEKVYDYSITVRVDDLFNENDLIRLMKIDTEGAELTVLLSAYNMMKNHRIKEMIVEFTPPYWEPTGFTRDQAATILTDIWNFGYTARNYFVYSRPEYNSTGAYQTFSSAESLVAWAAYQNYLQTDIHFTLDSSRGYQWGKP